MLEWIDIIVTINRLPLYDINHTHTNAHRNDKGTIITKIYNQPIAHVLYASNRYILIDKSHLCQ